MRIEVSIGEALDKISILSIKLSKFKDIEKKENVKKEYNILIKIISDNGIIFEKNKLYEQLYDANLELWDIEDNIRRLEFEKDFGDKFVELARNIYFTNDRRASIKKKINLLMGSDLMEEKEYIKY